MFEMQALCPACNTKKGAKMPDIQGGSEINLDALRIGQRGAVTTIVDRVRAGESYTAIVLPTRYGKTDVMRVAGVMLHGSFVSRSLILVPNRFLATQCLHGDKWMEAIQRYNLPIGPGGIPVFDADQAPRFPFPPQNAAFIAMTTQMASQQVEFLTHWVEYEKRKYGVPPLIFVDESHTGAEDNTWGTCVQKLAEAGAYIVLLTATPYRSDGQPIPGFEMELVAVKPVKLRRQGISSVDIYEGKEYEYRLVPHYSVTFKDAWAAESPPLLCKITRRPFDIALDRIDSETFEVKGERDLSFLASPYHVRRVLTNELRKSPVIRKACEVLVQELRPRREVAPETAAIIFVGNDRRDDTIDNQHALQVQSELRQIAPYLTTFIATSTDPQAAHTIKQFCNGQGDVLIVKQMAGVGLDVDRLKVCLDLSNIRTQTSFIQRLTRICTIWDRSKRTGKPWDVVRAATYITPDDILGEALFNRFVRDEGGVATRKDVQYSMTMDTMDSTPQRPDEYVAKYGKEPLKVQDSDELEAAGSTLDQVVRFLTEFPVVSHTHTTPRIAKGMQNLGFEMDDPSSEVLNDTQLSDDKHRVSGVYDINRAQSELRQELNGLVRQLARRLVVDKNDRSQYVIALKDVWNRHKKLAGISPAVQVKDMHEGDLEILRKQMRRDLKGT